MAVTSPVLPIDAAAILRANEQFLRLAQEAAGIGTWEWDQVTGAIQWSPDMYRILGLRPGIQDHFAAWQSILHDHDREAAVSAARRHAQVIGPFTSEVRIVRPDGEVRWILVRGTTVGDPGGKPLRTMGINLDITDRKRAEEALRESEERLNAVLTATRVGLWEVDLATGQLTASPTCKGNFGLPAEAAFPQSTFRAMVHPDDWPRLADAKSSALQGAPYEIEYRNIWPDGSIHWIYSRASIVRDSKGRPIRLAGMSLDITARRQAEEAARESERRLRDSEARLRVAMAAAGLCTWETNMTTGRNTWDTAMAEMLGLIPEEAERSSRRWFEFIHPEDRERSLRAFLAAARGGPQYKKEIRLLRPDGSERTVVASGMLAAPGLMVGAIQDVTEARAAAAVLARDKAELERLVEERTAALVQVSEERRRAEEAARQSEKLAALGQLAGGVAHDFNNVIQAVSGAAGLIRRHAANPARVQSLAGLIEDATRRGASVTRRLLAFARTDELRAEVVDVAMLLANLREVLAHTLGASVTVELSVAPPMPSVMADRSQLEAALVNLATNARDAMPAGGTLTLSAHLEAVGTGHRSGLASGSYVRLTVRDSGTGMDKTTLARAAEPFFTTKPHGKGTGLGLSMVRGFVERSGGALILDSEPGRGTCVTVWLPAGTSEVKETIADQLGQSPGGVAREGPRILLVDDEDVVREVLAAELIDRGYKVMQAANGGAALESMEAGAQVDLLITDLCMPGMDGIAVIRAAQDLRRNLPAILLTGYAGKAAALAVSGALSGSFSLLRKPVSGMQLADRAAALLETVSLPGPRPEPRCWPIERKGGDT